MLNQAITLHQLVTEPMIVPDEQALRYVLAQGKFGRIKVWSSHEISWNWKPDDVDSHVLTPTFFDLIVLGDPKLIAVHLVTDSVFFRGVIEAPISMTLTNGLLWVQETHPDKVEILDRLHWMIARVRVNLKYDRYHFTTVSILALIVIIDRALAAADKSVFAANIEQLFEHESMNFDPYSYSPDMDFRKVG